MDRIREALEFVDATDRDTWVRMGMALEAELGAAGFETWDTWSQGAPNYNARDSKDVWLSIRAEGGVSIGTLLYKARAAGWRDDGGRQVPATEDIAERRRVAAERAAKESVAIERERADTASRAAAILTAATEAKADNPYLVRKRVSPVATLREIDAMTVESILGYVPACRGEPLTGRTLVVPVTQGARVSTLELIDEDGRKAALRGRGTKVCGWWSTETLPDDGDGAGLTLLIGEGVATVLTTSSATGDIGVAALSSGNLAAVAMTMRERFPRATLVILAELEKATGEPDPHAMKAAREVGGRLAIPAFPPDRAANQTDFNDLSAVAGRDAVRAQIEAALPAVPTPCPDDGATNAAMSGLQLIRADQITPEPIRWLWHGWLARGKLHVIAGAPGCGKTTVAMALAATVTSGGRWPDGTRAEAGNVLIWSGEDGPADTLVPRTAAAGADLFRVHIVGDVLDRDGPRPFDPATDTPRLVEKAGEIPGGVALIIVDPIVSAVAGDSHKNAEVRRSLAPLVDLAARLGAALVGITHHSKGTAGRDPVERVTGSIAFGALARVVFAAAKLPEAEGGGRVLVRSKSNIGPDSGGFRYDLREMEVPGVTGLTASIAMWRDSIEGTAREILAKADGVNATQPAPRGAALADAIEFLEFELGSGPRPAKEIESEAIAAGISESTLKRAKAKLGVESVRSTFGSGGMWQWSLPAGFFPLGDQEPVKGSTQIDEPLSPLGDGVVSTSHIGAKGATDLCEPLARDVNPLGSEPAGDDCVEGWL